MKVETFEKTLALNFSAIYQLIKQLNLKDSSMLGRVIEMKIGFPMLERKSKYGLLLITGIECKQFKIYRKTSKKNLKSYWLDFSSILSSIWGVNNLPFHQEMLFTK